MRVPNQTGLPAPSAAAGAADLRAVDAPCEMSQEKAVRPQGSCGCDDGWHCFGPCVHPPFGGPSCLGQCVPW